MLDALGALWACPLLLLMMSKLEDGWPVGSTDLPLWIQFAVQNQKTLTTSTTPTLNSDLSSLTCFIKKTPSSGFCLFVVVVVVL